MFLRSELCCRGDSAVSLLSNRQKMSDWVMSTFQKTESKSVPLNLSGSPAAVSFGPRRVTNSSKSTWPSPAQAEGDFLFIVALFSTDSSKLWDICVTSCGKVSPHHPCPASGWWPPAPPRLACSPGSAWPSQAPASRWNHSHRGQTPWRPRGSLQRRKTHTCRHTGKVKMLGRAEDESKKPSEHQSHIIIVVWRLAAWENKFL